MNRLIDEASGRLWVEHAIDPIEGDLPRCQIEWHDGKITAIESDVKPPDDLPAAAIFLNATLTPSLLNAHCHLDYSYLAGKLPGGQGFAPWLKAMIAARHQQPDNFERVATRAARESLAALRAEGVGEIWDIDSFGFGRKLMQQTGTVGISFKEYIAPIRLDPLPAQAAMSETRELNGALRPGISPHSCYSVHPESLQTLGQLAGKKQLPIAIHLAESPEEEAMFRQADGPLLEVLETVAGRPLSEPFHLGHDHGAIRRADEAGLLGPDTLVIHANMATETDILLLAERNCVVCFCPTSHAYLGYPDWPWHAMKEAGVRVVLGTDSPASTYTFSMQAELQTLQKIDPTLTKKDLLHHATGAILGNAPTFGQRGRLKENHKASFYIHSN